MGCELSNSKTWTVRELLQWTSDYFRRRGLERPKLSAEILLAHVLGCERLNLYLDIDRPTTVEQRSAYRELVRRRGRHCPIEYLTGKTEFFSVPLHVSEAVFIPRPETELLVERAIGFLRDRSSARVLDLGTGSGCIAIALAANLAHIHVVATDISEPALALAERNVRWHKLQGRIELRCGDLFEPIRPGERFELIVCNPPYISAEQFRALQPQVRCFEPKQALLAGPTGLEFYPRLLAGAGSVLADDAAMMVEVGYDQADHVKELFQASGLFSELSTATDGLGYQRLVIGLCKASSRRGK